MPRRRGRTIALGVAPAVAALVLAAVPMGLGTAAAATPVLPPLPAPPGSSSEFYTPPSPLPDGTPGDVIRTEDVTLSAYPEAHAQKIMYLSKGNRGEAVAVTGLLLTPSGRTGEDNPLVVHTPGTRGLGDHCAPSKQADLTQANPGSPEYSTAEYRQFLLKGISVVVIDHLGQGTPDTPQYLVSRPEGQNGLDALRAVQRLDGSGVSEASRVGVTGYSQGGQSSAATAELQPTYAPELNFVGALVGGPVTDMNGFTAHDNGNITAGAGFALASLVGLDAANPELDLESRLTPHGKQVVENIKNTCVLEYIGAYGNTTVADVTDPDVLLDADWQKAYAESRLGLKKPGAPAYVYHGQADTIVPYEQGARLYREWCDLGADVQFEGIPGVEHLSGIFVGPPNGVAWLVDRLQGVEAPDGCREVGTV